MILLVPCQRCGSPIYKSGAFGSGWSHLAWFVDHAAAPVVIETTTTGNSLAVRS